MRGVEVTKMKNVLNYIYYNLIIVRKGKLYSLDKD